MFNKIIRPVRVWINAFINSMLARQTAKAVERYREYPAATTALLLVDTQNAFFESDADLVNRYGHLIEYAKSRGYAIVCSLSSMHGGSPYPPPARLIAIQKLQSVAKGEQVPKAITLNSNAHILAERTTLSAFSGPSLDQYLSNLGIEHLIIAGPLTNTTLDSTVRDAAQRDLHVTVLSGLHQKNRAATSSAEFDSTISRYAHHIMSVDEFKAHTV